MKSTAGLIGIGILLICLDQALKALTHLFLPMMGPTISGYPFGGIGIFRDFLGIQFSIHHVTNFGAAWGTFSQFPQILLGVRILLILGMTTFTFFFQQEKAWHMPMILIIAGAMSNVLDSFLYGHVVDMFHFILWGFDYPVFNIADSAVCIGVCWLGLVLLFNQQQPSQEGVDKT